MMKKITLLFFCFSLSTMFGQVPTIDFETNGASYIEGTVPANTVTIGAGTGTNTTQVAYLGNSNGQYEAYKINLDYEVDFSTAAKTISFDFYQSSGDVAARQILVKFQKGDTDQYATNGYEVEITAPATVGWQTLQFDFANARASYPNTGTLSLQGSYKEMYIFIDFGVTVASNTAIDNIGGGAQGAEIVGPTPPSVAAPTPPARPTADVISVASLAYTDETPSGVQTFAGATLSNFTVENPDDTRLLTVPSPGGGAQYGYFFGTDTGFDLTDFTTLHIDVWVADAGAVGSVLTIQLQNFDTGTGAFQHNIFTNIDVNTLGSGAWIGGDIDLSTFTNQNLARNNIQQVQLIGQGPSFGPIYFANLYFHKNTTLGIEDFDKTSFSAYPNPANDSWTLKTNNVKINSVYLYDILGKQVMTLTPNTTEAKIDASTLKSGLYFAKIATDNGSSSLKLIKN